MITLMNVDARLFAVNAGELGVEVFEFGCPALDKSVADKSVADESVELSIVDSWTAWPVEES